MNEPANLDINEPICYENTGFSQWWGTCPQSAGFRPHPQKKLSDKMLYLTNELNWQKYYNTHARNKS